MDKAVILFEISLIQKNLEHLIKLINEGDGIELEKKVPLQGEIIDALKKAGNKCTLDDVLIAMNARESRSKYTTVKDSLKKLRELKLIQASQPGGKNTKWYYWV